MRDTESHRSSANPSRHDGYPLSGVGIRFHESTKPLILKYRECIDFLEICLDEYLQCSAQKRAELDLLRDHFVLIPLVSSLSLGSAEGVDERRLNLVAKSLEEIAPPWWSEHLGFTRAGGYEIGAVAPLPLSNRSIDALYFNIETVRRVVAPPLVLRSHPHSATLPYAEMDAHTFLRGVVELTGCRVSLDLTGKELTDLSNFPFESLVQIQFRRTKLPRLSSHPAFPMRTDWSLFDEICLRAAPAAVVVRHADHSAPFHEVVFTLETARERWRERAVPLAAPATLSPFAA